MNNSDVVVGWVGLSLALVVGYGAYKNKPVFGPNGIVTTAVQTGKIGTGPSPSPRGGPVPSPAPLNQMPQNPGYITTSGPLPGYGGAYSSPVAPAPQVAPAAPSAGGGILSSILNDLKGLFGGAPTASPSPSPGSGMYV